MSRLHNDTKALAKIISDLQDVQKKINKNDREISKFLSSIANSGWKDALFIRAKKTTEEYQAELKPILAAMKKFENIKLKEKRILSAMGELKVPTKNR